MPRAAFKCVREVSSEDAQYKAENLLKQLPVKPWKTQHVGEKQAYVALELEKPEQIIGIDIGNEHSAFIQVMVGKNATSFTEILITCSFMTPLESRSSDMINRVRCFAQDALVESAAREKWPMVKIICTQPFNKHVQYGLAFIKLHTAESAIAKNNKAKSLVPEKFLARLTSSNTKQDKPVDTKFGNISLRDESPDSETESTSALFKRWQNQKHDSAAATVQADKSEHEKPKIANKLEVRDRNRNELLFGNDEENAGMSAKEQRLAKQIEKDKQNLQRSKEIDTQILKQKKHSNEKQKVTDKVSSPAAAQSMRSDQLPSTSHARTPVTKPSLNTSSTTVERVKKRASTSPATNSLQAKKPKTNIAYRPFRQLLQGVVLVISGIQNPDRADLRSKALAMGAKYRGDWDATCTHLICAFKNTPKYNQVKGQGKIIRRQWIEDCYAAKKYLPWRRFALDTDDVNADESDVEIWDESLKPVPDIEENQMLSPGTETKESCKTQVDLDDNDRHPVMDLTSGSDTEDEIERIRQNNNVSSIKTSKRDDFDVTTEEEEYLSEKNKQIANVENSNFFAKNNFFICHDIGAVDKIKLQTSIKKHGGTLTNDLNKAQYALTDQGITDPTDGTQFYGVTVQPRWVYECCNLNMKVPTQRYLI